VLVHPDHARECVDRARHFRSATFQVKPPGTKFGTIQSQFQPIVAILERCFLLPPLGEERCEHERAGRDCQQGRARGICPIVKVWKLAHATYCECAVEL